MKLFKERIIKAVSIESRNIIVLMRKSSMPFWRYHVIIRTSHPKEIIKLDLSPLAIIFEYCQITYELHQILNNTCFHIRPILLVLPLWCYLHCMRVHYCFISSLIGQKPSILFYRLPELVCEKLTSKPWP